MSTLKVNKIRDTAGSADSITLDPNGGAVIAGVTTVSTVKVGSGVTITSDGDIFHTGVCTATSFAGEIPAASIVGVCTSGLTKTGGFGLILQVKQVVKTDSFSTSSESSVDVTGLSVAITPTSSSNKILVIFSGYGSVNNANFGLRVFLMRGISGTFTEIARNYNQEPTVQSQTGSNLINQFLDSPSTTNEVTYKLQINTDNGSNSGRIGAGGNDGSLNIPDSIITVMEVSA